MMKNIALILSVLGFLALPPAGQAQRDISREYKEACDRLMCQCGCNEQLSVCSMQNCSSAIPMREEVRRRLLRGESVDAVVNYFVGLYGKKVLSAPTMKGFDLTAWIMPILIFGFGIVIVGWIVLRMVHPVPVADPGSVAVDPRIERELRDFEEES